MPYTSIFHPKDNISLEQLASQISALEKRDNKYALRGGSAINYDSAGRISSLNVGSLNGQVVNAQIANIDWAKIDNVEVENADIVSINASKITAGNIASARMSANVLTALQVNVSNLSAISSNMGTLTAGAITGGTITGVTITGGTIRSASSGQRVEISGAFADTIRIYDASGNLDVEILELFGYCYISATSGLATDNGLNMSGTDIREISELMFNETSSNLNNNDFEIWAYDSSEKGFRCRVDGSLYQFDLTSK